MAHGRVDEDFRLRFEKGLHLVTVNIIYYLPDHPGLVNEFTWQTLDLAPKYPRIMRFIDFWKSEIDAAIKEIMVANSGHAAMSGMRNVTHLFEVN